MAELAEATACHRRHDLGVDLHRVAILLCRISAWRRAGGHRARPAGNHITYGAVDCDGADGADRAAARLRQSAGLDPGSRGPAHRNRRAVRRCSGQRFVIFHGIVSADSDGPAEVCVPVRHPPEDPAELAWRVEAAHREAFIPVARAHFEIPAIPSISTSWRAGYPPPAAGSRSPQRGLPARCRAALRSGRPADLRCRHAFCRHAARCGLVGVSATSETAPLGNLRAPRRHPGREFLNRVLTLGEAHLRTVLAEYQGHYNMARPS